MSSECPDIMRRLTRALIFAVLDTSHIPTGLNSFKNFVNSSLFPYFVSFQFEAYSKTLQGTQLLSVPISSLRDQLEEEVIILNQDSIIHHYVIWYYDKLIKAHFHEIINSEH